MVRANYNNIQKKIYETTEYLEKFLRNLLLGEKNELHNREMHVSGVFVVKQDIDLIKLNVDPINDLIKNRTGNSGLTEREARIVDLLRNESTLTRAQMAQILGCSDATIKRALQSLVQKNAIRRIGSRKKGEWLIAE